MALVAAVMSAVSILLHGYAAYKAQQAVPAPEKSIRLEPPVLSNPHGFTQEHLDHLAEMHALEAAQAAAQAAEKK
jgi:hypothetical protein